MGQTCWASGSDPDLVAAETLVRGDAGDGALRWLGMVHLAAHGCGGWDGLWRGPGGQIASLQNAQVLRTETGRVRNGSA